VGRGLRIATKPEALHLPERRRLPLLKALREWTRVVPGHLRTHRSSKVKTRLVRTHKEQISRLDSSRRRRGLTSPEIYRGRQGCLPFARPIPRSRLVRTGPCSKLNVGQNTSSRATIQAVFFTVFIRVPDLGTAFARPGSNKSSISELWRTVCRMHDTALR
jgi:hypothetical protein